MKITQIIPSHFPSKGYGGAPLVVHEISRGLSAKGNEVIVITTNAFDKGQIVENSTRRLNNYTIFYLNNINNHFAYRLKLFLPYMRSDFRTLRKILKKSDIIHIHDVRTFIGLFAIIIAKKYNKPIVIQPHGTLSFRTFFNPMKILFDTLFLKKILKSASLIFALNRSEKKRIIRYYGKQLQSLDNVRVLPNGINILQKDELPKYGLFRETLGLKDNKIHLLLYLGRLHESKNIIFLLKSYLRVLNSEKDYHLAIVGPDDGVKSKLIDFVRKNRIEEKIHFIDYLDGKDKLSAFLDSDIMLLPSFYGFPLTILESFSCGTPVISTNFGDVIHGINGYCGIVTNFNITEFASAIISLANDKKKRQQLSINTGEFILKYHWVNIVNDLVLMYNDIL